jgi:hypothetical protein
LFRIRALVTRSSSWLILVVRLKHMWPFKPKLDEFGRSDLHYAARGGDRKLAERLVRRGADVTLA